MKTFVVTGGQKMNGTTSVSGAKNVALKALVAACLTNAEVIIENVPLISDFFIMCEIIEELGGEVSLRGHTATVIMKSFKTDEIKLDKAALIRTSSLFLAPLLARVGKAIIPNPGGCRIGARPIDRTIEGLRALGAVITYTSADGNFHATLPNGSSRLTGGSFRFDKNTHTGTETLILAAVLAEGTTTLENAAEEPEIDELIELLNAMGAKVQRIKDRTIRVDGVEKLHGTRFRIGPDRNEIVTMAIAALITEGDVFVKEARREDLKEFLEALSAANAGIEEEKDGVRFFYKGPMHAVDVTTKPYPGFMTDWQSGWAVLMTKANGTSVIHETVFESRFAYAEELKKMGAQIELFNPEVSSPKEFYNFNIADDSESYFHAAKIHGPCALHNAVVTISDLRAGATLVLAALAASGKSVIFGVEQLDRGYEKLDKRLSVLGAVVERIDE